MHWVLRYWIAIVIAVASIGVGVGMAMLSPGTNKLLRKVTPTAGNNESISNTYAPGVGDNLSNLVNLPTNTNKSTKKVVPGTYSTPLPLPINQVPWGTGPSYHQTPSTGGGAALPVLPPEQMPWGTGPSQQ